MSRSCGPRVSADVDVSADIGPSCARNRPKQATATSKQPVRTCPRRAHCPPLPPPVPCHLPPTRARSRPAQEVALGSLQGFSPAQAPSAPDCQQSARGRPLHRPRRRRRRRRNPTCLPRRRHPRHRHPRRRHPRRHPSLPPLSPPPSPPPEPSCRGADSRRRRLLQVRCESYCMCLCCACAVHTLRSDQVPR